MDVWTAERPAHDFPAPRGDAWQPCQEAAELEVSADWAWVMGTWFPRTQSPRSMNLTRGIA